MRIFSLFSNRIHGCCADGSKDENSPDFCSGDHASCAERSEDEYLLLKLYFLQSLLLRRRVREKSAWALLLAFIHSCDHANLACIF